MGRGARSEQRGQADWPRKDRRTPRWTGCGGVDVEDFFWKQGRMLNGHHIADFDDWVDSVGVVMVVGMFTANPLDVMFPAR